MSAERSQKIIPRPCRSSTRMMGLLLLLAKSIRLAQAANVQVILMSGQSNCQGMGDKRHLFELIDSTEEFARYGPHDGRHIDGRNDVYVTSLPERPVTGPLDTRFGDTNRVFGTEVGIGYELGDYFVQDDVLIVKYCVGQGSLAEDFLPPSATVDGQPPGPGYTAAIETFRDTINQIGDIVPSFDAAAGDTVTLLGFVWIHGYADAYVSEFRSTYGDRLAALLADVRTEFPGFKGQIVMELGGGGENPDSSELEIRQIQAEVVASERARVTFVESARFSGGEPKLDETYIHYFGRADNYIRMGEAIGEALIAFDATLAPADAPTFLPMTPPPNLFPPFSKGILMKKGKKSMSRKDRSMKLKTKKLASKGKGSSGSYKGKGIFQPEETMSKGKGSSPSSKGKSAFLPRGSMSKKSKGMAYYWTV